MSRLTNLPEVSAQNKFAYFKDPQIKNAGPPVNGKPTAADKFIYIGRCPRTERDITICYQTFGNPRNPCLLLISGLGSTCYAFPLTFCERLEALGFYVVRFDNRDYGLSTHMDGLPTLSTLRRMTPTWMSIGEMERPYGLEEMALDALNLLSALGISKAHILGASMGGMIAQCIAICQPERMLSVTILFSNCGGDGIKYPTFTQQLYLIFGKPKSNSPQDVIDYKLTLSKLNAGDYPLNEEETTELIRIVDGRIADDRNGVNRQFWAIRRSPSRENSLRQLCGIPTLIIHGMKDTLVPYENGLRLGQLIKGSKVVLFAGMGHSIPEDLIASIVEEIWLLKQKKNSFAHVETLEREQPLAAQAESC